MNGVGHRPDRDGRSHGLERDGAGQGPERDGAGQGPERDGASHRLWGQSAAVGGAVIGLDIGGTKIAGGVLLPTGRLLCRRAIPTGARRGGDAVLADAVALAADLRREALAAGLAVRGIGVGVAELVDHDGAITSAQTIAWQGRRLAASFEPLAPTVVESDVRAAALGEAILGAGRPFDLLVYVTVGTGISHCLVRHGRPYAGARGNALIFASAPLSVTCTACGAELRPVLEEIASGPALVAGYNRRRPGGARSGQQVTAAAAAGDSDAVRVVRDAGEALGTGVGWLVNVLDPDAVVVGGGLGLAGGLYWESFVEATRRHIWAENARDLPILPAALGLDAGVVGAAATFLARHGHEGWLGATSPATATSSAATVAGGEP